MAKKILLVAPNYGGWGEEQQAPWDILKKEGFEVTLATPRGKKPLPFAVSVDPEFVDPVLQGLGLNPKVNPPEVCKRVKELVDSTEWDNAIKVDDAKMSDYDAIALTCGPGAILDINSRHHVHEMLLEAFYGNKIIGALCYSVAALIFTRDPKNNYRSIIWGKKVTAHPRVWDFHFDIDHSGLYGATEDNQPTNVVTPGFLYPLEDLARDAVGPDGSVAFAEKADRQHPSVVYDHPFITGCSVESSIAYGEKLVEVLKAREKVTA